MVPAPPVATGSVSVVMAVSAVQDWSATVALPNVSAGGTYDPADGELVQPLQPPALPARTPTM